MCSRAGTNVSAGFQKQEHEPNQNRERVATGRVWGKTLAEEINRPGLIIVVLTVIILFIGG
jgi:hypothetical protein